MTTKRRQILLLSPPSEFYAYLLKGLAEGFKAQGYRCNTLNMPIEQNELATWARRAKACAVVEINRTLGRDVDWPKDVAHLAWIQDYRAYGKLVASDLGISDRLYFIVQPSVFGVEVPPDRSWSILSPGVRTDVPAPGDIAPERDFCFAGYIPPPLDTQAQFSTMPDGRPVTLGEFLSRFPLEALQQSRTSLMISNRAIDDTCARIGCAPVARQEIRRVFDEDLVRIGERKKVLESILTVSKSLEIFGAPTWRQWPQFAPHYRGFVSDPRALDRIFQTTRINMHNGVLTMHFRLLDCLAAGGFMMVNDTGLDFMPGGIRTYFEPGRHYVSYPINDAATVARAYLADAEARRRIAAEGRREVLAAHTWTHRAAKILDDLNLPALTGSDQRAEAAA